MMFYITAFQYNKTMCHPFLVFFKWFEGHHKSTHGSIPLPFSNNFGIHKWCISHCQKYLKISCRVINMTKKIIEHVNLPVKLLVWCICLCQKYKKTGRVIKMTTKQKLWAHKATFDFGHFDNSAR